MREGCSSSPHDFIQVMIGKGEFQRSGLDLRQVENVAYELHQQGVAVFDNPEVLFFLLRILRVGQQFREPDDRV